MCGMKNINKAEVFTLKEQITPGRIGRELYVGTE